MKDISPTPTKKISTKKSGPILLKSSEKGNQQVNIPNNPESYLEMQKNIRNDNPLLWMIKQKNRLNQPTDFNPNLLSKKFSNEESTPNKINNITSYKSNVNHPLPKLKDVNEIYSSNPQNDKSNKFSDFKKLENNFLSQF